MSAATDERALRSRAADFDWQSRMLPSRLLGAQSTTRGLVTYGVLFVVVVLLAALPFMIDTATMAIATRVLIFALLGIGWNVMSGFGGMFSFGHAAYFGIGAYTTAACVVHFGISPWIALVIGMALAVVAALVISWLAFRYRLAGAYYALSTFAFAEVLMLVAEGNDWLHRTDGIGLPVAPGESWWMFNFKLNSPNYYWIAVAFVGVALAVSISFTRARTGRFVVSVRDDEAAAAAAGINPLRYKLTAVAVSAAITAAAGMLYMEYYGFVDPTTAFNSSVSNNAIITAVVGGVGTIWGPLIGAIVTAPLTDLINGFLRNPPAGLEFLHGHSGLDLVVYAAILIVFVLFLPRGIYGSITHWIQRKRRK
ncbi:MAG TPA: branched-chain amino acid ABC transporter permease [Gryllotalpicola sp.]